MQLRIIKRYGQKKIVRNILQLKIVKILDSFPPKLEPICGLQNCLQHCLQHDLQTLSTTEELGSQVAVPPQVEAVELVVVVVVVVVVVAKVSVSEPVVVVVVVVVQVLGLQLSYQG
jgi:hypothetical protein